MLKIKTFVFNPFQVNTYLLYDESGQALIIDPACYGQKEENEIIQYVADLKLKIVLSACTHAHIDHILGVNFIYETYGLKTLMHASGTSFVKNADYYGSIYGFTIDEIILPDRYLLNDELVTVGGSSLKVLYTPGHCDGHVAFYSREQGFAMVGDVIFFESIGRTDLPTGDYQLLISSIQDQLFILDDKTWLFPGHGHETTIEHEKKFNPFLNQQNEMDLY